MHTAVVIDDMDSARELIRDIINSHYPYVTIIGEANSVKTATEIIAAKHPDIVILDVQLDDGTGFDILNNFNPPGFKVIFVSAYDTHAVRAFKFSAMDYILKPVNHDELIAALDKTVKTVKMEDVAVNMQVLQNNYVNNDRDSKKIILKTRDNIYLVKIKDIIHCQSDVNHTNFFLSDGRKILITRPLKEFDDMLSGLGFFRIHQSHLINLDYFEHFNKADGGFVVLKNSTILPVSSRKRDGFLKIIQKL